MPVFFTPGVMKEHGCSISTIYQMSAVFLMKEHGCTIYQMKLTFFTPGVMKEHGCSISTIYQMKSAGFFYSWCDEGTRL